jgi:hypothetical protein
MSTTTPTTSMTELGNDGLLQAYKNFGDNSSLSRSVFLLYNKKHLQTQAKQQFSISKNANLSVKSKPKSTISENHKAATLKPVYQNPMDLLALKKQKESKPKTKHPFQDLSHRKSYKIIEEERKITEFHDNRPKPSIPCESVEEKKRKLQEKMTAAADLRPSKYY